jgi:hypothetical protein
MRRVVLTTPLSSFARATVLDRVVPFAHSGSLGSVLELTLEVIHLVCLLIELEQ